MIQRSRGHQLPGTSPQVEGAKICMHACHECGVCVCTCMNAECVYEQSVSVCLHVYEWE